MSDKYAVIEMNGIITSTTLDKFLASKMTIIEECDASRIEEKTAYWNRIYHPIPEEPDRLKYHFYNKKLNKHLWTTSPDRKKSLRGLRHKNDYHLTN